MALRFSTALRNAVASGMSWNEALANGRLYIYTGTQPDDADSDPGSVTTLVTFTKASGIYTAPIATSALATVGGTDGTITAVAIGGANAATGFNLLNATVTANASNTTDTAVLVAASINAKVNPFGIKATSAAANVTITCPIQSGIDLKTMNIFTAVTANATLPINGGSSSTIGGTGAANVGGAAANGCNFQVAANGAIAKETTAWSANAAANGTAGWFRYVSGGSNAAGASVTDIRFDGRIATSGADLNLSSTTITANATQTINTFTITVPANNG